MTGDETTARAPSKPLSSRVIDGVLVAAAILVVVATVRNVVRPMFTDLSTLGGHDWDEMEAQRWLVVKSIREFHQFPFWNPYACGGFSAWGAVESDTTVISPFLPIYLVAPLAWALRIEVVGAGLMSALGAWLLAGRFTRSAAVRVLVSIVFAVNGRWALQTATGHAWHLYYAYTPWVFYEFDRAVRAGKPIDTMSASLCGLFVALMVYSGAIYPLPETALLVAMYAAALAIMRRDWRPLSAGVLVAVIGAALSAPKLVSLLEDMARWPRLVDSPESIDLHALIQLLIERNQDVMTAAAPISYWGWHEYGMYIGWFPALAVFIGLLFAKGQNGRALRWPAIAALLLGLGHFHTYSPWAILHELPLFKSQHVPTRWLYPAVLLAAVVAASAAERALVRMRSFRPALEVGLMAVALFVGLDIAEVSSRAMSHAFWMKMRPVTPVKEFHMEHDVPPDLQYVVGDYAPPALPATLAGIGVIRCTLHPGLNIYAPSAHSGGGPLGMGAIGRGEAGYRGEAYMASGKGSASVERFSPNRIAVDVVSALPGDLLVLNQNWDPGWRANGAQAMSFHDAVAVPIAKGAERVTFTYRPHFFWLTLLAPAAVVVTMLFFSRRRASSALFDPFDVYGRDAGPGAALSSHSEST